MLDIMILKVDENTFEVVGLDENYNTVYINTFSNVFDARKCCSHYGFDVRRYTVDVDALTIKEVPFM